MYYVNFPSPIDTIYQTPNRTRWAIEIDVRQVIDLFYVEVEAERKLSLVGHVGTTHLLPFSFFMAWPAWP